MLIQELTAQDHFGEGERFVSLYCGTFNIAPIVHEVMTGRGLIRMFGVYEDAQLVGAATLKSPEIAFPIGEDVQPIAWVISDVIVDPAYRGRGIGLKLVEHLEGVATESCGGRILYLYTEQGNAPAISLYQKAGFERLRDQGGNVVLCKLVRE